MLLASLRRRAWPRRRSKQVVRLQLPLWNSFDNSGTLRHPSSLRGGIRALKSAPSLFWSKRAGRSGASRRRDRVLRRPQPLHCSEKQKCNPASSNQSNAVRTNERADDLKPYGLNRREAREPAPRPQCGPLLLHTPIEAEASLRASDERFLQATTEACQNGTCRFSYLCGSDARRLTYGGDAAG